MTSVHLSEDLLSKARIRHRPDGSPYHSLSMDAAADLSGRHHLSGRAIEIAALKQEIIPERYARNLSTISPDRQITLLNATVAVAGLGGLGGCVTDMLARIGIGAAAFLSESSSSAFSTTICRSSCPPSDGRRNDPRADSRALPCVPRRSLNVQSWPSKSIRPERFST